MKILIDEQAPVQLRELLKFLLPGHRVDHVDNLTWKSKGDVAVIVDARKRGYDVFVTNDQNQLADPVETKAIMKSRVHHVRYVRGNGRDCQRDRLIGS